MTDAAAGFGLDNLPYGVDQAGHVVVAWQDQVVDLAETDGIDVDREVWTSGSLNRFMALGNRAWARTRSQLQASIHAQPARAYRPRQDVELILPVEIGDYADFYASRHHAENMSAILRPGEDPLPPSWLHLPIGYHGRAGTIVVSGTPVTRPAGITQTGTSPQFTASQRLDVEVEIGFVVGTEIAPGQVVPASIAEHHVFGVVLINDWSARDIQAFEYRPLGPFLGKSFATSMSPWVVPLAALAPSRIRGPVQDPRPARYLAAPEPRGLDIELTLSVNGTDLSSTNASHLYWSMSQQMAHLAINGSGARTGDLFASGTISGPTPGSEGSLMELWRGSTWLHDGDTVTISGRSRDTSGQGWISLGEVTGHVLGCPSEVLSI